METYSNIKDFMRFINNRNADTIIRYAEVYDAATGDKVAELVEA